MVACHTISYLLRLILKVKNELDRHSNIKVALEQNHADCYGWALYCCNQNKEFASDVLQTAYLKILEKQNTFAGQSDFKTWAFTIIKNTAIDALRKEKKKLSVFKSENNLSDTEYETAAEPGLDIKKRELLFAEAINKLSERQRQILQLVFYHGLSLNQSAEVLRISQGSARKHYDRAKKALAVWFEKKGITILK